MQCFSRILQNFLIFNAFFNKILVKSQENFEKSQENFSKKLGKISQLDLWQPCVCLMSPYEDKFRSKDFAKIIVYGRKVQFIDNQFLKYSSLISPMSHS